MSTSGAEYREAVDHLPEGGALVLRNVSWDAYEQLLAELADRPGVRLAYDQGKLEIMSPLPEHEEYIRLIERIVHVLSEELDLNVEPRGSATWKRKRDARGAEADGCYYIENSDRIIGKRELDIERDPPPDLVVEIDATNESLDKFPIYATFGVPEIWRYEVKHERIQMYELRDNAYAEVSSSRSFGVLTPEALVEVIGRSKTEGQKAALTAFRRWLRSE